MCVKQHILRVCLWLVILSGFTFDPEFYDVAAVLQAVQHLAAIVARVAGAQLSQPQRRIVRRGRVVEPDAAVPVRLVYLDSVTLCHQDLRLDAAGHHRPFDPWFHGRRQGGRRRGGEKDRAGDGDGAAQ